MTTPIGALELVARLGAGEHQRHEGLDVVAGRELDAALDAGADVVDHAAEIAAARVGRHHDPALHVLAHGHVVAERSVATGSAP
jgi:hypothetical protein